MKAMVTEKYGKTPLKLADMPICVMQKYMRQVLAVYFASTKLLYEEIE